MVHGFGDTIPIDQLDYLDVAKGLCGPTSLCMLASAALGYPYTPADLYRDFPYIDKYRDGDGGFGDGLFRDKKIMERLNLTLENEKGNPYYYGKAWTEGLLMDSLEEGKRAIWCTQNKIFTDTGHYIELELKDGKIWLNDPNGENNKSMDPTLRDILDNGCTPEQFKKYGGRFYIFDVANSEGTGKTYTGEKSNEVLMNEILEKCSTTTPTKPTNQTRTATRTEAILQTRTATRTTTVYEKVPEIPLYDQRLYKDVPLFRNGNLAEQGCGIFVYSEVLQYLLDDPSLTPERLAKLYEGTYSGAWGTSGKLFDETAQDYGLTVEKLYPWEGWVNTNKIQTALKNGQPVIAYVGPKTGLTGSGHYVVLTGMTEDGKVIVRDSNGANLEKASLKGKFEDGFDVETFSKDPDGGFWIFPAKDKSNITNSSIKNENATNIKEVETYVSTRTTTNADKNNETNRKEWTGEKLTAAKGGILNGPSGSETWYYDVYDPKDLSGVVSFLEKHCGFKDLVHYTREDGVFMLSGIDANGDRFNDLVMVAADVKYSGNPNGIFERGQRVETSLGAGIVADYCEYSKNLREKDRKCTF